MAYLTVDQLSERWQVKPQTIRYWKKAGKLPFYRLGSNIRFSMEDVEAFEAEARHETSDVSTE